MRADRLLALVLVLQQRGKMTAEALAAELEVSRRTILRDVEALSIAGIPVYADGGHGGGIALDSNYRTTLTGLAQNEAAALAITGGGRSLGDVGLDAAARTSLLKLLAALPAAHQPTVEHLRQRLLIDPDWWWQERQPAPSWEVLQQAVYEDRRIRVVYENFRGEVAERVLEPYSLVAKSSLWYLVARREGEFRIYRARRLQQIALLDEHFERIPDFDLPTFWAQHVDAFAESITGYAFTLRVHRERIDFIKWAAPGRNQVVELEADDEWAVVRLHLDTIELAKMLVFGLGADAQVIDPPELWQAVLDSARALLSRSAG